MNTYRHSRRAARRSRASNRGFSIIEALLAFVVMLIGVLGTLGALGSTFGNVDANSERIQAVAAAQQYMDAIRQWEQSGGTGSAPSAPVIAIDAGESSQGNGVALTSPGNYDFSGTSLTPCALMSGKQYDCKVTVAWTIGGYTRQLTVESYVTQQ